MIEIYKNQKQKDKNKDKKLFLGMMNVENEKEATEEENESNEVKALTKQLMAERVEKIKNKYKTKTIA